MEKPWLVAWFPHSQTPGASGASASCTGLQRGKQGNRELDINGTPQRGWLQWIIDWPVEHRPAASESQSCAAGLTTLKFWFLRLGEEESLRHERTLWGHNLTRI